MERTRTSGSFSRPFNGQIHRTLCNGSSSYTGSFNSLIQTGSVKTTTDVVTPGYRSIIERGGIINNPFFSQNVEKTGSVSGSRSVTWVPTCTGTGIKTDVLPGASMNQGAPVFSAWDDAENRNAALYEASTKALAGVASGDIMLQVELLEMHKTLMMIRHPLKNMEKYLRDIRASKDFRQWQKKQRKAQKLGLKTQTRVERNSSIERLGDFIESEWLRYRYGIIPLMSSIKNAIKLAQDEKQQIRHTSRASVTRKYKDLVGTEVETHPDSYSKIVHSGTKTGTITARAGVLYAFQPTLHSGLGLRVSDVPSSLWEIVPYSFVADWFANTGEYISAITPKADVSVLAEWSGYTEVVRITTQETAVAKTKTNFAISDSRKGRQTTVQTTKSRSPEPLQAGLVFRQLALKKPSDWNHLADGLALISSSLRR